MRMNEKEGKEPRCFTPEENNPYPLCVGRGLEKCENCCLYADYKTPYDRDIIMVRRKGI